MEFSDRLAAGFGAATAWRMVDSVLDFFLCHHHRVDLTSRGNLVEQTAQFVIVQFDGLQPHGEAKAIKTDSLQFAVLAQPLIQTSVIK